MKSNFNYLKSFWFIQLIIKGWDAAKSQYSSEVISKGLFSIYLVRRLQDGHNLIFKLSLVWYILAKFWTIYKYE